MVMTRAEEIDAFRRLRAGDESQREKIVKHNKGFVVLVVSKYQNIDYDLALASGMYGLLLAIDRFDHTRGHKFISYAVWWIKQSIRKDAADAAKCGLGLPENRPVLKARILDIAETYLQKNGTYPSDEYLAEVMCISARRIASIRTEPVHILSMDHQYDTRQKFGAQTMHDFIAIDGAESVERPVGDEETGKLVQILLEPLDHRARQIVCRYHGLDGRRPESLDQIGATMGVSRERIRQLKLVAYKQVREHARKRRLAGRVLDVIGC